MPLCTGDKHLGDATPKYSPELTVEYNGFVKGTATLNYLAEHYPDATQVVVVDKGTAAAPIYGGPPPTCSPTPTSRCSAPTPAATSRPRRQRRVR